MEMDAEGSIDIRWRTCLSQARTKGFSAVHNDELDRWVSPRTR